MNAQELIEAVSKMTPGECPFCRKTDRVVIDQDYSRESIRATVKCTRCRASIHGDWADDSPSCREDFMRGKQALVGHWNQALQSLISERDAALARVAELEAWRESAFVAYPNLDLDIESTPNVRDAGPTPYSGRTTRRDEG